MISQIHRTFKLFFVLFVLTVGVSTAGAVAEFPGCTVKVDVAECCEKMACCEGATVGNLVESEPTEAGCSHNGICSGNGLLPAAVNDSCIIDFSNYSCLPPLRPSFIQNLSFIAASSPFLQLKLVPPKLPPLYIRNCSFLS
ncbi:MAG: hypothetical protein ACN4GW_05125 [Desulforhopalus sp.]